jgi:hypothetical protein
MKSVFFWSEEHARNHRKKNYGKKGLYLTLAQNAFLAPLAQEVSFEFNRCPLGR